MKRMRPLFLLCLSFSLFSFFFGCAHYAGEGTGKALVISTEAFKFFNGDFENTPYFKKHKPASVAVLPFQYPQKKHFQIDAEASDPVNIVRRGMYNHVASLPFKDLEIYDIDRRLKNAGLNDIRDVEALIRNDPKKLRSILGVDAVVSGTVTHFDRIFAGIYSQVAVGCEVNMWDLKKGQLLWHARHVSRAHAGGISLSPIGLAMATVAALWNLRETELLSQTDALFREIVSTMEVPASALAAQAAAPQIDLFSALNTGKPFTLGKQVRFRIIGDPGCKAYVDLGDYKVGIPLAPVSAAMKAALQNEVLAAIRQNLKQTGQTVTPEFMEAVAQELAANEIYEGAYTVEEDEQNYDLIAKSYLVDSAGNQGTAIDAAHNIDIDSRPPKPPAGLAAASLNNSVKLTWTPNPDPDLAGYEIWTSASPLSGYQLTAKSEKNETILAGLINFSPVYVQVRAVDRAENSGKFCPALKAVPLPEPGLYDLPQPGPALGGEIQTRVLLVAEKNPYTVFSDVMVTPKGGLYIEPGVEIHFAPDTVLKVAGGELMAYGDIKRPIRFAPASDKPEPGAWQGIILEGSPKSLLQHVTIEQASIGLSIADSAPTVYAATVSGSAQAGLLLQDNAKPNISCSRFTANEGQGGMVIEGEGLAPIIHHNRFENNMPFQVQSYTPLEIDLRNNYWGSANPQPDAFLGQILLQPVLPEAPGVCP